MLAVVMVLVVFVYQIYDIFICNRIVWIVQYYLNTKER